ncbi:hypothetical protein K504DRAFT_538283 [Pleomassaria siparia CBS 279.74]|uniref:Uncharacterized protein n=1 Tax=Pleomassaria siparia CBS 279.74 TaxID=1314801 RepID=A0A6G1JVW3_9PLEO|nr:hypothetical protein K504DRAFT_538283 [Pleomassaria siparia CBS 279.74]
MSNATEPSQCAESSPESETESSLDSSIVTAKILIINPESMEPELETRTTTLLKLRLAVEVWDHEVLWYYQEKARVDLVCRYLLPADKQLDDGFYRFPQLVALHHLEGFMHAVLEQAGFTHYTEIFPDEKERRRMILGYRWKEPVPVLPPFLQIPYIEIGSCESFTKANRGDARICLLERKSDDCIDRYL